MNNVDLESNDQQIQRNNIIFLDKAQIALDALQAKEKEKIIYTIYCLQEFPSRWTNKIHKLKSAPYFVATAGVYRIVFIFNPGEITIVDIVNHNRLEVLFDSLKEAKA